MLWTHMDGGGFVNERKHYYTDEKNAQIGIGLVK